jgi:hypothetical protein
MYFKLKYRKNKIKICFSSGIYRLNDESNKIVYSLIYAILSGRTYLGDKRLEVNGGERKQKRR